MQRRECEALVPGLPVGVVEPHQQGACNVEFGAQVRHLRAVDGILQCLDDKALAQVTSLTPLVMQAFRLAASNYH